MSNPWDQRVAPRTKPTTREAEERALRDIRLAFPRRGYKVTQKPPIFYGDFESPHLLGFLEVKYAR